MVAVVLPAVMVTLYDDPATSDLVPESRALNDRVTVLALTILEIVVLARMPGPAMASPT